MLFGWLDEFFYSECALCGCVQLQNIPKSLALYYPVGYYSFSLSKKHKPSSTPLSPSLEIALEQTRISRHADILDVGCGAGELLLRLRQKGFVSCYGIDQYISSEIRHPNGVVVYNHGLSEVSGLFDAVILNHSFEHMLNPWSIMDSLYRIVVRGGWVVLRIPLAGTYAHRTYGIHWVQFDAPRHLFLYTEKSIGMLARETGFSIVDIRYDSTEFQFWGSEQYRAGIPLRAELSYHENQRKSMFSRKDIREFQKRAHALNTQCEGDQAMFLLRKTH